MTKDNKLTSDTILSQLYKTNSLWSAIAWIAAYTVQHERTVPSKDKKGLLPFSKWKNSLGGKLFQAQLRQMFSVLSSQGINRRLARSFIENWIEMVKVDNENFINCCRSTLIELDTSTKPPYSKSLPGVQRIGPLNNSSDGSGYLVIPRMNDSLQSNYLARMNVRRGRNVQTSNPDSILSQFNNYMFISVSALHSKDIEIIHYSVPQILECCRSGLRISVAPVAREDWFTTTKSTEEKAFRISYPNRELNSERNNVICDIIRHEAEDGSNIVIFPELAMNCDTVQYVKEYLWNNGTIKDSILLIFLGTYWGNYCNEGCVLSGSGTEIFRCQKQTRHEYYSKDDGINYIEQLDGSDKILPLLDVPSIGRIGWRICRDFLNLDLNYTYRALGTSMEIVSCFSNRLHEMYSTAEENVKLTGTISVAVNKCLQDEHSAKTNHGFCCIPRIDSERIMQPNSLHFDLCGVCSMENCCCSRCAHHFTISRDIDFIETGRWYEKAETN